MIATTNLPPPYYVYPFCGLFVVGGFIAFIAGIRLYREAKASSAWPSTIGTIEARKIKEDATPSLEDGKCYFPTISYRYIANGRRYTGNRITFTDMGASIDYAKTILKKYPVGRDVKVYYNPAEPKRSVLNTGVTALLFVALFIGLIFMAVGTTAALLYYFR